MSEAPMKDVVLRPKSGRALATWRKARAVELALAGVPYDDIAAEVGYSNRGTAWNVVNEALRDQAVEGVETYRRLELARLEALQRAYWATATSGSDLKSAELCLKVIAQRTKLLGLEGLPQDDQRPRTIIISSDEDKYASQLQALVEGGTEDHKGLHSRSSRA